MGGAGSEVDTGTYRTFIIYQGKQYAKAIVMGYYYYIFGGYHNHKFFIHRESLEVVQKSDLPENFLEKISRFEKNGNKSVIWSKCSYLMADDE